MIPVLTESETVIYIDEGKIVKFISENAPMEWNDACEFVREHGITGEEGTMYWTRNDVFKEPIADYDDETAIEWLRHFFDAHPWLNRIKIVFDD